MFKCLYTYMKRLDFDILLHKMEKIWYKKSLLEKCFNLILQISNGILLLKKSTLVG